MHKKKYIPLWVSLLVGIQLFARAGGIETSLQQMVSDSSPQKSVQNYIRPAFFLNTFRTNPVKFNKLGTSYAFSQTDLGFYMPLFTKTAWNESNQVYQTFHFLLTGNFLIARPEVELLKTTLAPKIFKPGIGLRAIYANGKKNTWFVDVSPFVAQDGYTINNPTLRFASIVLFNRTVSRNFSYRIGMLKTFVFGEALPLPILGVRLGPLDGVYLNIHLPRNISLNFPLGSHLDGSAFFKPMGGVYNFRKGDNSILSWEKGNISAIEQFRRKEYLSGLQISYSSGSNFSIYIGGGLVTNRKVILLADKKAGRVADSLWVQLDNSVFINFGLTLKFGEAKRMVNNLQMYDVFDLNNSMQPGDNNSSSPNMDIPRKNEKAADQLQNLQYQDVKDLFDTNDLY